MSNSIITTTLLVAAFALLLWRGIFDLIGIVLSCTVVLLGLGRFATTGEDQDEGKVTRCRSQSEFSFSLGEPESPFLQVLENQMSWLEEETARTYHVLKSGALAPPVQLREPLSKLRKLVQPLLRQSWQLREPMDDIFLCRLLIAKDFNVDLALPLATTYVAYREEMDGGVQPPSAWTAAGMVIVPFEDRQGRPVVVVRAKFIDASMSSELLRSGYRSTVDGIIAHLLSKRSSKVSATNPLEQYVLVFDSEGAGWSNFSTEIVKIMVNESNNHYPERLARIYVVNCTSFSRYCFKLCSGMLHPRTVKKTQFITTDQVPALMTDLVDLDKLPVEYGGNATSWVPPSAARNLDEQTGVILAKTYRRLGLKTVLHDPKEEMANKVLRVRTLGDTEGMCCWRAW